MHGQVHTKWSKYEALLSQLFQKVLETVKEPYTFAPYHEAIRGTDERSDFDYYALGNEFATGVINNDLSELVGLDKLDEIEARLDAGDNVVLLANHQSEADPQIFSVTCPAGLSSTCTCTTHILVHVYVCRCTCTYTCVHAHAHVTFMCCCTRTRVSWTSACTWLSTR